LWAKNSITKWKEPLCLGRIFSSHGWYVERYVVFHAVVSVARTGRLEFAFSTQGFLEAFVSLSFRREDCIWKKEICLEGA
jgi:hypothetical protein